MNHGRSAAGAVARGPHGIGGAIEQRLHFKVSNPQNANKVPRPADAFDVDQLPALSRIRSIEPEQSKAGSA
jgi:hypothetical protein